MDRERRGLKTVSHSLVDLAGGVDAAASVTRVGRTVLCDYSRPGQPHFMPIDVAHDLERAIRRPVVTQHLALLMGFDLVPIVASEGGLLPAALAKLGRDVAALFGEAAAALADGQLSDDERQALRLRAAEARLALGDLSAVLEAGK